MSILEHLEWVNFCWEKYQQNKYTTHRNEVALSIWLDAINGKKIKQ